eukprot:CAMPEP_0183374012 /NCGR_PEP_ID=MMETSP0164_2-20130417/113209_1 /TAXON_ID=221442 /ORGANISM="Coccolithus pelagicus ssp braarudi, Strain PLY182g" /LENGTH=121 /DNA_ID=CAMNT_0025550985 /DNA_START=14 /DNA_END=375 /DNA_ORIENTATION=-
MSYVINSLSHIFFTTCDIDPLPTTNYPDWENDWQLEVSGHNISDPDSKLFMLWVGKAVYQLVSETTGLRLGNLSPGNHTVQIVSRMNPLEVSPTLFLNVLCPPTEVPLEGGVCGCDSDAVR